jgi:hypothetical protein
MRLPLLVQIAFTLLIPAVVTGQTVKDQVGFNQLRGEIGGALPDGNGLVVSIVEAPNAAANYFPDTSSSQFAGKTFTDGSGTNDGTNGHANSVSIRYFGSVSSLSPGIDDITCYDANDLVNRVLGFATGTDPTPDSFDIANHSYVANGLTAAQKFGILSRFDFVINRDNTVAIVGANNGSGNATPDLMAPSYNAVAVGRSDGNHSQSLTSEYGAARTKPELVGPESATSFATPFVSSASGILLDAAQGTNGAQNEAIKAMLFAGATKEEFPDWDRTSTRPIDETFGFGELNIYTSYKILEGGEYDGATSNPSTNVGAFGYDFATFDGTNDLFYDFEVTEDSVLSAALTWNAEITDTNPSNIFAPVLSVANLDLRLYDSSGSFLGLLLDDSVSTDYNHEHIWTDLPPGQYTLRVSGDSAVDFGLAWRIAAIPNVVSVELNGAEAQRSAIETVTVLFDREVYIADGAFSVVQRSTATEETFEAVTINVTEQVIGGQTQATIQFDSHTRNTDGALEDGNYQLEISALLVNNLGVPLPDNLVLGSVEADGFFAYYGDSDGNRTINIFDLLAFRQTYRAMVGDAAYRYFMDFEANGIVDIFDLLQFRNRYRTTIPFSFNSFGRSASKDGADDSSSKKQLLLRSSKETGKNVETTPIPTLNLKLSKNGRRRR